VHHGEETNMSRYLRFETENIGDVLVARLVDHRLADTMSVNELTDELLHLLNSEPTKKFLVNFQNVTHCSTSVINGLLRAKKKLLSVGGQIKLCNLHPVIREAYQLLNLDGTVFHIHDTEAEALAAYTYI
jgi:anti-sigma B factor antagonist